MPILQACGGVSVLAVAGLVAHQAELHMLGLPWFRLTWWDYGFRSWEAVSQSTELAFRSLPLFAYLCLGALVVWFIGLLAWGQTLGPGTELAWRDRWSRHGQTVCAAMAVLVLGLAIAALVRLAPCLRIAQLWDARIVNNRDANRAWCPPGDDPQAQRLAGYLLVRSAAPESRLEKGAPAAAQAELGKIHGRAVRHVAMVVLCLILVQVAKRRASVTSRPHTIWTPIIDVLYWVFAGSAAVTVLCAVALLAQSYGVLVKEPKYEAVYRGLSTADGPLSQHKQWKYILRAPASESDDGLMAYLDGNGAPVSKPLSLDRYRSLDGMSEQDILTEVVGCLQATSVEQWWTKFRPSEPGLGRTERWRMRIVYVATAVAFLPVALFLVLTRVGVLPRLLSTTRSSGLVIVLLVVAILAILTAILFPVFGKAREKAQTGDDALHIVCARAPTPAWTQAPRQCAVCGTPAPGATLRRRMVIAPQAGPSITAASREVGTLGPGRPRDLLR
jgi:hypothetical protein